MRTIYMASKRKLSGVNQSGNTANYRDVHAEANFFRTTCSVISPESPLAGTSMIMTSEGLLVHVST